jgi:hypothetical protein
MIEPVYVPYEQYRAAKTGCGLDSRIYGIFKHPVLEGLRPLNLLRTLPKLVVWSHSPAKNPT